MRGEIPIKVIEAEEISVPTLELRSNRRFTTNKNHPMFGYVYDTVEVDKFCCSVCNNTRKNGEFEYGCICVKLVARSIESILQDFQLLAKLVAQKHE